MPTDTGASITSSFQVPTSGTDTFATFYQILSVQSLHYLTLCIFIPPLLSLLPLSSPSSLEFEGGAAQVGMILDWRELSSRKTFDWTPLQNEDWLSWRNTKGYDKEVLLAGLEESDQIAALKWKAGSVWMGDINNSSSVVVLDADRIIRPHSRFAGGGPGRFTSNQSEFDLALSEQIQSEIGDSGASKAEHDLEQWEWTITRDPSRGWAIAFAWLITTAVDVFLLTTVVRRPKHILDHVATLHLVHFLLTSYYSSSLPTSLFWWIVMGSHAVVCVVWAERWSISREMGREVGRGLVGRGDEDEENIPLTERSNTSAPHVLFDGEENDEDEGEAEETDQMINNSHLKPTMNMAKSNSGYSHSDQKQS
ncbi:unnamed protein product [Sympodiomycopsis kandeliae]